jgi:C4-dicarboxylate-binding protein DctP
LEAIEVRKPDIEQDDLGTQSLRRGDRPCAIGGRANDRESLVFEQHARGLPEAGMVVDDKHGLRHRLIVADPPGSAIVANPSLAVRGSPPPAGIVASNSLEGHNHVARRDAPTATGPYGRPRVLMRGGRAVRTTTKRAFATLLAGALGLVAGCSWGGEQPAADKAGGSSPVVLRLAYPYKPDDGQPDEPMVRDFAARVAGLSHDELRVRIEFTAAGEEVPGIEARVARTVRAGEFELGWVAARAWDELGIESFQALQAPFLITDYDLLDRVATSSMADEMLAGLDRLDLTGLALVPELLRHPAGVRGPLVSVGDFAGARIRDIPSRATDALLEALGATPVHVSNARFGRELTRGHFDGVELAAPAIPTGWTLSGNVVFFGKANTLFANPDALEGLTEEQRAVLSAAASQTVRQVVAAPPSERALVRRFCSEGRVAVASRGQLAGLWRAARPLYERLERDPQTRSLIARIERMKRSLPRPAATHVAPCPEPRPTPAASGKPRSPSELDGTYRWLLTKEAAIESGAGPNDPEIGSVVTMTLEDGRWQLGVGPDMDRGTFTASAHRLVFDWPRVGSVLTFTYSRDPDGTLNLKPVPPMNRGDRFVWAGGPWRRIGPPIERP